MTLYASFRTDLPAFYGEWLYNRLRYDGYLLQPNPMNPNQVQRIDTKDIEAIVFCSKNYKPFMKYVKWFNDNFKCVFHYTINSYGTEIEPGTPNIGDSINTFKKLSGETSKQQVIWRYDPILFTNKYDIEHHKNSINLISKELKDYTEICILSFVSTIYPWVKKNIPELIENELYKNDILTFLNNKNDLHYQTCGHGDTYYKYENIGISSCTGVDLLERIFNLRCNEFNKGHYRPGCGCIPGVNVGQYNSCMNRCKYCYAARNTYKQSLYDVNSPILLGTLSNDAKITHTKSPKVFKQSEQLQFNF